MKEKTTIMDESDISRAITRISHEILEKNKGIESGKAHPLHDCAGYKFPEIKGKEGLPWEEAAIRRGR